MKRNKINLILLNGVHPSFILNLSIWKIISNLKVCGDVVFSSTMSYIFDALKFTYYKKKTFITKSDKTILQRYWMKWIYWNIVIN